MTNLIVKTFIKDYKNVTDSKVRMKYGILSGCVGIALNVLLCLMKFFVGSITGSIAITADAVNLPIRIIRSATAESNISRL